MKSVLVTGGAGFIGSHLTERLTKKGYRVVILDNLSPQIHGEHFEYRTPDNVKFIKGDVRNESDLKLALKDVEIIVHLAAETGTGQSMYEVHKYADVNVGGTAILLDLLVNQSHTVTKVVVASSRAVYGEGKYKCEVHGVMYPEGRREQEMAEGSFEPVCRLCNRSLTLLPTDEESGIHPSSVYGITKFTQEQMIINVCKAMDIDAIALRYQNVYGPGQSLKNPYTGILSIFSTLIRNGKNINVFEDGLESRDFVYIGDVVKATILGMESKNRGQEIYNVGSGVATTVLEVASKLKKLFDADIDIEISGNYRLGDIRHNIADIKKIKTGLGFIPEYSFDTGIAEFAKWVKSQDITIDRYDESLIQMKKKGLLK